MADIDTKPEVTQEPIEAPAPEQAAPEQDTTKQDKTDNAEIERLKRLLSKANSEASTYKQQLREKQSEAERAEAERIEAEKAKDEELENLRKTVDISDTVKRSMGLNINADISQKLAEAWNAHDKDAMFTALGAFVAATETRLNNEALNRQPGLSAGVPPTTNTINDDEMDEMRRYAGLPPRR